MFLRKIIPLVMCVLVSTSVFANKEQAENPRVKKASHAEKSDKIKQGVYYGQIEFKPVTSRRQKSGTVVLQIREKSSKKIIARTTADESGNFRFENIKIQKGLELSWSDPHEPAASIDEDGCFELLPHDPAPPIVLLEECDDSELVLLRTGLSSCTVPPCPWEKEIKELSRPEKTN